MAGVFVSGVGSWIKARPRPRSRLSADFVRASSRFSCMGPSSLSFNTKHQCFHWPLWFSPFGFCGCRGYTNLFSLIINVSFRRSRTPTARTTCMGCARTPAGRGTSTAHASSPTRRAVRHAPRSAAPEAPRRAPQDTSPEAHLPLPPPLPDARPTARRKGLFSEGEGSYLAAATCQIERNLVGVRALPRRASDLHGAGERCASELYGAGERCASELYRGERSHGGPVRHPAGPAGGPLTACRRWWRRPRARSSARSASSGATPSFSKSPPRSKS
jgi:hypothetical protein